MPPLRSLRSLSLGARHWPTGQGTGLLGSSHTVGPFGPEKEWGRLANRGLRHPGSHTGGPFGPEATILSDHSGLSSRFARCPVASLDAQSLRSMPSRFACFVPGTCLLF
jgi:hypothetical protein